MDLEDHNGILPLQVSPPTEERDEVKDKAEVAPKSKAIQKHRKNISKCGHQAESYYANGMCKNCYHAKGRTKKASLCPHKDRTLYAKGVCKNCYLSSYHKIKRSHEKHSSNEESFESVNQ
jgi:hypothetical protein